MEKESTKFIERIENRNKYLSQIDLDRMPFGLFEGPKQYVHTYNLYLITHKVIPSRITFHHEKENKLVQKIEREFSDRILNRHYMRYSIPGIKNHFFSHIVFIMENQVMIDIELAGEVGILFNETSEKIALEYEKKLRPRLQKKKESKINMLTEGHFGCDLTPLVVKKPDIDLAINYNDGFTDVHKLVLKSLKKKNQSGIILFHGNPGTGKSTYIRYLINLLNKKIIFLPPLLAASLESPGMTRLLTENKNSIFIIEDAEQLIKSREVTADSKISMLLNLTDGILGESLSTTFICTFNTELKNIDEALLRKGRLIASYKFEELAFEKLLKLKEHLGLEDFKVEQGMVLSDLYHTMENRFGNSNEVKKAIGF